MKEEIKVKKILDDLLEDAGISALGEMYYPMASYNRAVENIMKIIEEVDNAERL